ncbi:hypothetical protein V9T40_001218 [Parthenolecanium corni]|uniref:acid phosphatase n=1 Tax=Parthenolecanium corni TaxID=536013 RepID=A0AAN9Y157_9HEMI
MVADIRSEVNVSHYEDPWESSYGKIIHASVLFRHGDRSVIEPYPTDPYPASIWQDGLGQLSKLGKEHEYELGLWLRLRYKSVFEDRYRHDAILVDSSNIDRTLMSAELVLAAMFPPRQEDMWNKLNFTWQPIPVHTVPVEEDYYIHQETPCNRYDVEVSIVNSSPDLLAYYQEHEGVLQYVGKYSGFTMTSDDVFESFWHIDQVHDALLVESLNNFTLPQWTHKVFPHPLRELSAFSFFLPTYTHEMRRLKAGPFLGRVLEDMRKKIDGNFNQTLHIYSGHDSTIANVLSALGQYNFQLPPYSSSVLFELREKDDNYFITILYRNSSTQAPYLLNFTECGGVCTVDQFINLTANLIPSDYVAECNIGMVEKFITFHFFHIIVMVSIAVMLFMYGSRKRRIQRYVRYQRVKNEVLKTPA